MVTVTSRWRGSKWWLKKHLEENAEVLRAQEKSNKPRMYRTRTKPKTGVKVKPKRSGE